MAKLTALMFTLLVSQMVLAKADFNSYCYKMQNGQTALQGLRVHEKFPIASVTKVFTSYWALKTLGADYRYSTRVHIFEDNAGAHLHFEGSVDPYFAKPQLQFLVAQLNRMGFGDFQTVTFDENFEFLETTRDSGVAAGKWTPEGASMAYVADYITNSVNRLNIGWQALRDEAETASGQSLPQTLSMNVPPKAITPLLKSQFDVQARSMSRHRVFTYKSVPLIYLLKELNRNSNNYAADLVFRKLGGAANFSQFLKSNNGLDQTDVTFYNGSGYPLIRNGKRADALASCEAVVNILGSMETSLKAIGKNLHDVLSVVGANATGEQSTLKFFVNDSLDEAVAAKTGTTNVVTANAGEIKTEAGEIYYAMFVRTKSMGKDHDTARAMIKERLIKWMNQFGGKKEQNLKLTPFIPFDRQSVLIEQNLRQSLN